MGKLNIVKMLIIYSYILNRFNAMRSDVILFKKFDNQIVKFIRMD